MKKMKQMCYGYIFLMVAALFIQGCGGGGGGAERGTAPTTQETNLNRTLNEPTGDTPLTAAQIAANTEVIESAIAADDAADWTVDPNPDINGQLMTDMTATELDALTGSLDNEQLGLTAGRSAGKLPMRLAEAQLPTAIDWRSYLTKNWMTPVRNQGNCGSCVAHAALGTLEAMVKISQNSPDMSLDLSESDLFRCTGTGADQTGSCANGWHGYYAATQIKNVGVVTEACLPYLPQDNVCQNKCANGSVTKIKDFVYASTLGWGDKSTDAWIKNALLGGPVLASITVYQDFFQYKSGIYKHVTGKNEGGHAIVIAGYDDKFGYWIVRNSWGANWGSSGYVNIKYGEVDINEFIISYQMDTVPVSVLASVSPASGMTGSNFTVTCATVGGSPAQTPTLEARCSATGSWTALTGTTHTCTYNTAGSYTPSCRVNGTITDDTDAPVTVTAPAACGNGAVESGEQCDDGNTTTESCTYGQTSCTVCNATCQNAAGATSYCGNSTINAANSEQCDDGNTAAGDGCSATCQTEIPAVCGNGSTESGEQCDDGNTATESCTYGQTSCTVCNATCQNADGATSYCGNSTINAANGEQCDDGNTAAGDGCSATCQTEIPAVCGNGATESGEQCDDANTTTESCTYGQTSCTVCNATCQNAAGATTYCGDNTTDAANSEQCDDGNTATEACAYGQTSCTVCNSTCQNAAGATSYCGDSATDAANSEQCDDGNTAAGDGCSASCQTEASVCGNGATESGEQCDDSNTVTESCAYGQTSCTVCDATCQNAAGATSYCGDTTTDAANGEGCDDGNTTTEDCTYGLTSCTVCNAACQSVAGATSYCGDFATDTVNLEQCEDGNTTPGDGCDASCHLELPACTSYTTDMFCNEDPNCWWYGGTNSCYSVDCVNYINQTGCDSDFYCSWNAGGGVCDSAGYCAVTYTDQPTCESDPYCTWDAGYGVCYDTISCLGYGGQVACEADAFCAWDAGSFTCYEQTCALNLDSPSCALNASCTWDAGSSVCYDDATCLNNIESVGCGLSTGAGPGCTWDPGTCDVNTGGRCDTYTSPGSCDADSYCFWNSGFCFEDPTLCWGYSDQITCNANSDCGWDAATGGVCYDN